MRVSFTGYLCLLRSLWRSKGRYATEGEGKAESSRWQMVARCREASCTALKTRMRSSEGCLETITGIPLARSLLPPSVPASFGVSLRFLTLALPSVLRGFPTTWTFLSQPATAITNDGIDSTFVPLT